MIVAADHWARNDQEKPGVLLPRQKHTDDSPIGKEIDVVFF